MPPSLKKYKHLLIVARDSTTDIWVGDDEGNLVQKEIGRMDTHLLPGKYTVEFKLGTERRFFELVDDLELRE